jgi:hypothetical protein
VVQQLDDDHDVVLVCRSGQGATKAAAVLQNAGLAGGRVLEKGIADWEGQGFAVDRGVQRWELERQVRLVAGSIVLSSVVGSVAVPRLKWLAAAIGAGLTYPAVSNTVSAREFAQRQALKSWQVLSGPPVRMRSAGRPDRTAICSTTRHHVDEDLRRRVGQMNPNPDYDASDELEYGIAAYAWLLRGVYPPPSYAPDLGNAGAGG